eukprot:TRINITY_DN198_c0_g2_i1.p1 TRINITY_DN198_c0_g2~~TRINITY_DN198_c0_g2_i1.p1  ORF type:complete len:1208 (-),score=364.39 TRINITY_DN198_c0_g2_i1:52-3675(-)
MAAGPAEEKFDCIDGNTAACHVAYSMSDCAFIYPITPSSPMAELADVWSQEGRKNVYGNVLEVTQMESELGAAGAVHGAAQAGALVTTFTASQGLLLMVPAMYKVVGELLPVVFHVAARQVAATGGSIYGEHSDVMACRQTGIPMLCSHSVQEVMDLALVAHVAALRGSLPVLHFFDGFQLSHEMQKIRVIAPEAMKTLIDPALVRRVHEHGTNPTHPRIRSMLNNRDTLFQAAEANNTFWRDFPEIIEQAMRDVSALTGRPHGLFEYEGAPDAERVVILMGAGSQCVGEVVRHLVAKGEKVGFLKVHLFRPFSAKHFLSALPETAHRIAVLDRCKEPGASGEPLYLEVASTLLASGRRIDACVGGRYSLGDKAFTPAMAKAVFDNVALPQPKRGFTVGIDDDLTQLSLPVGAPLHTVPEGTHQCMFWGLGSDGTIGANRVAIQMIGRSTPLYAQGYFFFTAHKAGGVTTSHLRFGPAPITSSYPIEAADYVACHHPSYVRKYVMPMVSPLKDGGVFVLNSVWPASELIAGKHLPPLLRRELAKRHAKVFTIDAYRISKEAGLGGHINTVMQVVFFKLSKVMDVDKAVSMMKDSVAQAYKKKGAEVIAKNQKAIDAAGDNVVEVQYDAAAWAAAADEPDAEAIAEAVARVRAGDADEETKRWLLDVKLRVDAFDGERLPVSSFDPRGSAPTGSCRYEKRAIATQVPLWNVDTCVQCCTCAMVCPHAAIRPFLFPADFKHDGLVTKPAKGVASAASGTQFRIQVSPLDCTGCGVCASACPVKGTLTMTSIGDERAQKQVSLWDLCAARDTPMAGSEAPINTPKGSQLVRPLFEFCGACAGCGEAAYIKLLTQLFGERLVVSNAAGCSAAIAIIFGSSPYTRDRHTGWGPCLSGPLFENNAEFGFGISKAHTLLRGQLERHVRAALADPDTAAKLSAELRSALERWLQQYPSRDNSLENAKALLPLLDKEKTATPAVQWLWENRDQLPKMSHWLLGGDGWAYDINFGGLDHVLSQNHDVRILILDTELYSNTGGQKSKGSAKGSVLKFASGGQMLNKKDFGAYVMATYPYTYVAHVALDANPAHTLRAFLEADAHEGPSVVIAYCPCIEHGIEGSSFSFVDEVKLAVASGYWPLYRYNPVLRAEGKNPFTLDSAKTTKTVEEFLKHENRFQRLVRERPERARVLHQELVDSVQASFTRLQEIAAAKRFF